MSNVHVSRNKSRVHISRNTSRVHVSKTCFEKHVKSACFKKNVKSACFEPFGAAWVQYHPGGNLGANFKSTSQKYYLREVAVERELTKETIDLPLGGSRVVYPQGLRGPPKTVILPPACHIQTQSANVIRLRKLLELLGLRLSSEAQSLPFSTFRMPHAILLVCYPLKSAMRLLSKEGKPPQNKKC